VHWLLAVLVVLASTGGARDAFTAAVRQSAEGQHREAREALVRIADETPADPLADDALFKAAQISEEQLADPARAVELYDRLIEAYSGTRLARRAEGRLEVLRRGLGEGGRWAEALGRYQSILTRYGRGERLPAIADMESLVRTHPEFPLAGDAMLWIGVGYRQDGRLDEAIEWLDRARRSAGDPDLAWRAGKAHGDALLSRGDYGEAAERYRALDRSSPARAQMVQAALERLGRERGRARLTVLAWMVVTAFVGALVIALRRVAGSWPAVARALVRPPTELIFLLPVAVLWVVIAAFSNTLVARAVLVIAAGGVAVTWLSGAVMTETARADRLSGRRIAVHAAAAAIAVAALCYVAVEQERLIDLIGETIRFGPER
jgi:outer membrane protein assembly factor BamD (BamD/ComL family)